MYASPAPQNASHSPVQKKSPEHGSSQAEQAKKAASGMDFAAGEAALKPPSLGSNGGPGQGPLQFDIGRARHIAKGFAVRGLSDESFVTDQVFFQLFPWLNGQKLAAKSPEAKAWLEVRGQAVRVEIQAFKDQMKPSPKQKEEDEKSQKDGKKSDAEVVPGNADFKGNGSKAGTGDAYLSQNDNSYDDDLETWYRGSASHNTCNMTALAMALISIAGSEEIAKQAVAAYLRKVGPRQGAVAKINKKAVSIKTVINDASLIAKVQLEDLCIAAAVIQGGYDKVTTTGTILSVAKMSGLVKGGQALGSTEKMKNPEVLARAKQLLAEGKRVIVGTVNHYVYLTAVRDDGILVHDPAGARVTVSGDPKYLWPGKASDKLGHWDNALKKEPVRTTTLRRLSHNPEALALFEQEAEALTHSGAARTAARNQVKKDHPGFIATGANNFYGLDELDEYNCRIRVILEPTEAAKESEGKLPA